MQVAGARTTIITGAGRGWKGNAGLKNDISACLDGTESFRASVVESESRDSGLAIGFDQRLDVLV